MRVSLKAYNKEHFLSCKRMEWLNSKTTGSKIGRSTIAI